MKIGRIKRHLCQVLIVSLTLGITGCNGDVDNSYNQVSLQDVVANAMSEGSVTSLAMPGDWANWEDTWEDLNILYGIDHSDTDMSSVEELTLFNKGTGDIGDVGYEYGKEAKNQQLTLAYKTSYWDEIPDWAKDDNGDWIVCYTGTLSFLINPDIVKEVPSSWKDVLQGDYKVGVSDVANATLGQYSVYAAAIAMGSSDKDITPGIDYFKKLAEAGRLVENIQSFDDYRDSEVGVMVKWDFQALSYRDQAAQLSTPVNLTACIPSDGSVTVGYASIINAKAAHPYGAMLAREYILSDSGQTNLAQGYATPIRAVKLPEELEQRRIPKEQYTDAMIESALAFDDTLAEKIAAQWTKTITPILANQQ